VAWPWWSRWIGRAVWLHMKVLTQIGGPRRKNKRSYWMILDGQCWWHIQTYSAGIEFQGFPILRSRPACKHFFYGFLSAKMGNKSHHFGVPSELNFLDPKNRRLDGFPRSFFLLMRSREISPWAAWAHREWNASDIKDGQFWKFLTLYSKLFIQSSFCWILSLLLAQTLRRTWGNCTNHTPLVVVSTLLPQKTCNFNKFQ